MPRGPLPSSIPVWKRQKNIAEAGSHSVADSQLCKRAQHVRCHDAVPSDIAACERGCVTGSAPTAFVASPQCLRCCLGPFPLQRRTAFKHNRACMVASSVKTAASPAPLPSFHPAPPLPRGLHNIQSPSACAAVDYDKARCEYQDREARDYVKSELAAAAALQVIILGAALPCGFSAVLRLQNSR